MKIIDANPTDPRVISMVAELDQMMMAMYPAESNYLTEPISLTNGANKFFGVEIEGELLGIGALMEFDGYGEVKRIFVHPKSRGNGIATAILNRLEREARSLGLVAMKLETGTKQPDAIALFEREGFVICDAFGDYPVGDPYSVFMQKKL